MDALTASPHHSPVRVLPHIKRLDDSFGDFLVRVACDGETGSCSFQAGVYALKGVNR